MPRLVSIAALVAVLLSGCGGSPSVDDQPSLTEQMVEIMKTIQDADSAKSAAPKLEDLAEKIRALQKESLKGAAPSDPEKFAERQLAALEAYGEELTRISNIPGAPQQLQNMIKKMTADGEMVAAFSSRVEAALGEAKSIPPANRVAANAPGGAPPMPFPSQPPPDPNLPAAATPAAAAPAAGQTAAAPAVKPLDLRPDPNYKGRVPEGSVPEELSQWFPTAKKGDFVEFIQVYSNGRESMSSWERHEVLEIDGEWALIASVYDLASQKWENRVRMRVAADKPWPPAPHWPPKPLGDQTITTAGRQFHCQGVKHGGVTSWYCDEVPYNRVVQEVEHGGVPKMLFAFGRGSGPSPIMPATVAANPAAPPIPTPQAPAVRPASPPPTATTPPPTATSPPPAGAIDSSMSQKIEELQTAIEEHQRQLERLNVELKETQSGAEGLEKKLKRLAISSSKSKRGKDAKNEFERELNHARSEISRIKREIKSNEQQLSRAEKQLKTYQERAAGKR